LRLAATGGWALQVTPRGSVPAAGCVSRVDVSGLPAESLGEVIRAAGDQARDQLAPTAGALVRMVWFDAGCEKPGRLLILVHHLAVDGVSWRILLPDLARAWKSAAAGMGPVDLGQGGTSYRRWVELLRARAVEPARQEELALWSDILRGAGFALGDVLLDPVRDVMGSGRSLTLTLPAVDTEPLLTTVPAVFRGGVNDVLLAALGVAVADWSRRRGRDGSEVLCHLEGHGREEIAPEVDLSGTVGWFTSIFPVRLDLRGLDCAEALAGGPALGEAVKRVKEHLRSLPDNGIGYGLLRYLNPATRPLLCELEEANQPQISFNYLGRFTGDADATEDGDWGLVAEDGLLGGADAGLPFAHVLEINALVNDTDQGPQLSVSWS
jgi:non-ribosomal peptide synthase protein (TIGR01720 family)